MEISFGAKLLTNPTQFIRKGDTALQRANINKVFGELEKFLTAKKVDKISAEDTVELVRGNAKNSFRYQILYSSPKLEETLPIKIHVGKTADDFHTGDALYQIAHLQGYLNGKTRGITESFHHFLKKVYDLN